jgi:hypothetical protein
VKVNQSAAASPQKTVNYSGTVLSEKETSRTRMTRFEVNDLMSLTGLNTWIDHHPVVGCKPAQILLRKAKVNCMEECPFPKCMADCSERTESRLVAKMSQSMF